MLIHGEKTMQPSTPAMIIQEMPNSKRKAMRGVLWKEKEPHGHQSCLTWRWRPTGTHQLQQPSYNSLPYCVSSTVSLWLLSCLPYGTGLPGYCTPVDILLKWLSLPQHSRSMDSQSVVPSWPSHALPELDWLL